MNLRAFSKLKTAWHHAENIDVLYWSLMFTIAD